MNINITQHSAIVAFVAIVFITLGIVIVETQMLRASLVELAEAQAQIAK